MPHATCLGLVLLGLDVGLVDDLDRPPYAIWTKNFVHTSKPALRPRQRKVHEAEILSRKTTHFAEELEPLEGLALGLVIEDPRWGRWDDLVLLLPYCRA